MRCVALTIAATAAPLLGACSDHSMLSSPDDPGLIQAAVSSTCELAKPLSGQFKTWLGSPTPKSITELVRTLGDDCSAGNQTGVTATAWQLVATSQEFVDQHAAGDPVTGSAIINSLLACTTTLCSSAALPGIDFAPALGTGGLFSLHGSDTQAATARDLVPFTDFTGTGRTARWGVEVSAPWSVVTVANPVLVFGAPVLAGRLTLNEISIGNLQYALNVFPDAGEFVGDDLHVGVCFNAEIVLPTNAQGLEPRMRREGVLLEDYTPGFCPPATSAQTASILSPLFSLARALLPRSIAGRFRIGGITVVGGTPLDFSRFAPIAAISTGQLSFVNGPDAVVVAGQSIGTIRVLATSGDGTPMEKVPVSLYIIGNNGLPAGAVLSGDLTSFTEERTALQGIATFPDNGGQSVTLGKAGGYRLCASATLQGFTFPDVCSAVFNARNAN